MSRWPCIKQASNLAQARATMWLVFVLVSAVLVGGLHREGHIREEQLCHVVINVHRNAVFREHTEQQNMRSTLDYLSDPQSRKDAPHLYLRVKENLPIAKQRLKDAQAGAKATRIPPICEKYLA